MIKLNSSAIRYVQRPYCQLCKQTEHVSTKPCNHLSLGVLWTASPLRLYPQLGVHPHLKEDPSLGVYPNRNVLTPREGFTPGGFHSRSQRFLRFTPVYSGHVLKNCT